MSSVENLRGGSHAAPGYAEVEHELKTPLTSIRALTEILLHFPDISEGDRSHFLALVAEENKRLGRTIERLLGDPRFQQALATEVG